MSPTPFLAVVAALGFLPAGGDALAYCVHNGIDRDVSVVQEEHKDRSREPRKLDRILKPGQQVCCNFYDLDCSPDGREEAVVGLAITILGEPPIRCGLPGGRYQEPQVGVTSTGTLRILRNPRTKEAGTPYVVRSRARDGKDLSGPAGIACRKPKENP